MLYNKSTSVRSNWYMDFADGHGVSTNYKITQTSNKSSVKWNIKMQPFKTKNTTQATFQKERKKKRTEKVKLIQNQSLS